METITLSSDLSRNIKFKGIKIASSVNETGTGTYTRMALYKTSGNNYACYKVYETRWQGCSDKHLAVICKTENEVISFFGLGNQAKDIYSEAGIEATISEEEYLMHGNPSQEYQDLNEFDE